MDNCLPFAPPLTFYVSLTLYALILNASVFLPAGVHREGFGLLDRGSEVTFLLRVMWQAVPETPGVWQPHQLLRPCTQTGRQTMHLTCSYTNWQHIDRKTGLIFWFPIVKFGSVTIALYVLIENVETLCQNVCASELECDSFIVRS